MPDAINALNKIVPGLSVVTGGTVGTVLGVALSFTRGETQVIGWGRADAISNPIGATVADSIIETPGIADKEQFAADLRNWIIDFIQKREPVPERRDKYIDYLRNVNPGIPGARNKVQNAIYSLLMHRLEWYAAADEPQVNKEIDYLLLGGVYDFMKAHGLVTEKVDYANEPQKENYSVNKASFFNWKTVGGVILIFLLVGLAIGYTRE